MVDAISFDISKTAKKNLELLKKRFDAQQLKNDLLKFLDFEAGILAGKVVKQSLSGRGKNSLGRRTGSLARSVIGRGILINGVPAMRIGVFRGPALAYAGIHEYGGIIKPKKAKSLAVPVGKALTPTGVARYTGPRNFPGELAFLPFRRGIAKGKLVDQRDVDKLEKQGKSPYEAAALYLLLTKVVIKKRAWLRTPVIKELPKIARSLGGFFAAQVRGSATRRTT